MNRAISRFLVVAAITALVTVGVTPVLAQITFNDFSNTNGLTLNPSAARSGSVLRLTPATTLQAGSAWFNTPQAVAGGFSTTFKFQLSGVSLCSVPDTDTTTPCPADGIAFVIQNSGTGALGPAGCGIGFGGTTTGCNSGTGITNSLAVEFDTFNNGGSDGNSGNHVAVQSCGTGPNTVDETGPCSLARNYGLPVTLADGGIHSVTISYASGKLSVSLDNNDLFPGGIAFDLTSIGLTNGTALVGFTGSTGASVENNDILSWTFTPQAQSAVIAQGGPPAVLNFNGGPGNGAYEYDAQLDMNSQNPPSVTVQVKPIPIDEEACEQLVQKSFPHTQCFVYKNADGLGHDSALMFELTCPSGYSADVCGDATKKFFATLGTQFTFDKSENPGFKLLVSTIGPYPGWLKGDGGVAGSPCTPPSTGALFQSNQITSFSVTGDPLGTTKGKSGGGGSCWVATYFTSGEAPPGVKINSPTFTTYHQGTTGTANYTCSDPKTSKVTPPGSPVGPYLTAATCIQNQAPNLNNSSCSSANVSGVISCTGTFDLSVKGLHVFTVTSKDSGGNVGANVVIYNVVK
jgi:Legume lectin domain